MLDHQAQQLALQRQQFQTQLFEIDNALKELKTSTSAYKIIGNIMVSTDKATLTQDLEGKKELMELRISSCEKQEKQLREKVQDLQKTVLKK